MAKKHKVKNGIVVMLDVLGARSFSSKASLQFLKTRKAFLDKLQEKISLISQATLGMELDPPEIVTFQDSLILTWDLIGSNSATPEVYMIALGEWLKPAIPVGLHYGLLFRGAIAIGEFIQEEATILGPAVSDAAEWYEKADWFGILATPSCGLRLSFLSERVNVLEKTDSRKLLEESFIQYNVPFKNGSSPNMWVVNWPSRFKTGVVDIPLGNGKRARFSNRAQFLMPLSQLAVPAGAESKFANTIAFFDWFQKEHQSIV